MIAHLKGKLLSKSPVNIIVDVNGVGYQVFVPLSTYYDLPEVGGEVSLGIHTHMREETLRLFGFLTGDEQTIFEKLITINKVGPKLALGILSGMPTADLLHAIADNDVARLSTIPGVGRKTAERLALEMRDKLSDMMVAPATPSQPVFKDQMMEDALSALINLGYKKPQAEKALQSLGTNGADRSLEDLIRDSLNLLS